MKAMHSHRREGNWLPSSSHLDNLGEIQGTRKNVFLNFPGFLRCATAMRLINSGVPAPQAFLVALTPAQSGSMPHVWGDDPPRLTRWNYRAAGRIFATGRTWLVVDPRRRDSLTGLPPHRVICTADPAFKKAESILTAPDEGMVEGDPETVIVLDLSALGCRLCAGLGVDPAEFLVTPEPAGGWQ
jgi:hypothetical protein